MVKNEWKWVRCWTPFLLSAQLMFYNLYPWQPESRALNMMKGTESVDTGHFCFDVFTLHEKRMAAIECVYPWCLGTPHLLAATSLALLSPVTFSKSARQSGLHPPHLSTFKRSDSWSSFMMFFVCLFVLSLSDMKLAALLKEDVHDPSSVSTDKIGCSQQSRTVEWRKVV